MIAWYYIATCDWGPDDMQKHQRLQAVESDRDRTKGQTVMELWDTRCAPVIDKWTCTCNAVTHIVAHRRLPLPLGMLEGHFPDLLGKSSPSWFNIKHERNRQAPSSGQEREGFQCRRWVSRPRIQGPPPSPHFFLSQVDIDFRWHTPWQITWLAEIHCRAPGEGDHHASWRHHNGPGISAHGVSSHGSEK